MALVKCKECGADVSTKAEACPKCGAKVPKGMGWGTKLFLGIVGVGVIGALAEKSGGGAAGGAGGKTTSTAAVAKSPKEVALEKVTIEKLDWRKEAGGNIMVVDITFKNSGMRDVKDIELRCDHASNSGTVIDSNKRTIYELVRAGKTFRAKDFNMGFIHSQAAKSGCVITDLVVL